MDRHAWISFFFGTPKRFLWTAAAIFGIFWLIFPGAANPLILGVLDKIAGAAIPLMEPAAAIVAVVLGFWVLLRPARRKAKKGH